MEMESGQPSQSKVLLVVTDVMARKTETQARY